MARMIYVYERRERVRVFADGPMHAAIELGRLYGWDADDPEVELIDRVPEPEIELLDKVDDDEQ